MDSSLELNTNTTTERVTLFADVILPLPLPRPFTYRLPLELNDRARKGCRVVVPFGKKKVLTGIIANIHDQVPEVYEARYILELLDEEPQVNEYQLLLFNWVAEYYCATTGEVMNIALPSGLKLSSESYVQLHPEFNPETNTYPLSDDEDMLVDALSDKQFLSYQNISELFDGSNFYPVIKSLIKKEIVIIFEKVKEKYKPKIIKKIRLAPPHHTREGISHIFQELESKHKQLMVLMKYLQLVPAIEEPERNAAGIEKSELLQQQDEESETGISPSSLNTLLKNNVLEEFEEAVPRISTDNIPEEFTEVHLTPAQARAKDSIMQVFEEKNVALLHGVTGSGKTEIYVELIKEALSGGSQVLYLLPEIALTTQIVGRLKKIFGDSMGVYHSKFSDNERVEVWQGVIDGRFSFVVGVRSAIMLPFDNLGLIVVDEEHETSYKQFDPAPRYNARDLAIVMAKMHHAKVILGSATPAVESYYQAGENRYGLVNLHTRYADVQLPEISLVDIKIERQRKTMKGNFSSALIDSMRQALLNGEQVIIFQNRRGYSPFVLCEDCAHIPKCTNCDVSLTYHQYNNQLVCHYCGYKEPMVSECPACGSSKIQSTGYGTERLEEEIVEFLPEARVQRMDLDTTRKKNSYQQIIDQFAEGELDILVGTQMVSKGLDFDRVSLVGILDADRMIHFPDFRSYERTFDLITQVSGRAGRRAKQGKVLIQTNNPQQPILQKIIEHDYPSFYASEISEREKYRYPPFVRLIRMVVKHPDKRIVQLAAVELTTRMHHALGKGRVLGPEEPMIGKIRGLYLMQLLIKLERNKINLKKVKEIIQEKSAELTREKTFTKVQVTIDVDPF